MHQLLTNELLRERNELLSSISEIVARTQERVAISKALLAQPVPTTFLGVRHYPPPIAEDDSVSGVVDGALPGTFVIEAHQSVAKRRTLLPWRRLSRPVMRGIRSASIAIRCLTP
jgi:hypothetical protein